MELCNWIEKEASSDTFCFWWSFDVNNFSTPFMSTGSSFVQARFCIFLLFSRRFESNHIKRVERMPNFRDVQRKSSMELNVSNNSKVLGGEWIWCHMHWNILCEFSQPWESYFVHFPSFLKITKLQNRVATICDVTKAQPPPKDFLSCSFHFIKCPNVFVLCSLIFLKPFVPHWENVMIINTTENKTKSTTRVNHPLEPEKNLWLKVSKILKGPLTNAKQKVFFPSFDFILHKKDILMLFAWLNSWW